MSRTCRRARADVSAAARSRRLSRPRATLGGDTQSRTEQITLGVFIVVPFLAVLVAVPIAWGGWLGWTDVAIALVMYAITGHGITVGFHRLFTHKSFKPNRAVKIALAIAGSMAIQGPVVRWVADHRKHHKFSDREGDPHSPWRYGTDLRGARQGLLARPHDVAVQPRADPAAQVRPRPDEGPGHRPDLPPVPDSGWPSRCSLPPLLGGLVTWSWQGALTAFFWALAGPGRACCTTSPGRSTRSATPSASARSSPATSPPTCGGWRSRRWASPGTTCTTPTRPAPGTACSAASSTPAPGSSGPWRSSAGSTTSAGRSAERHRRQAGRQPGAAPTPPEPDRCVGLGGPPGRPPLPSGRAEDASETRRKRLGAG